MQKDYRFDLDLLKGISIIAVVLYHIGILPYGYLGVDTFLVINGFLIIPNVLNAVSDNSFSFGKWFLKRLDRFVPIVLIASVLCLGIGYFTMIPDDYENLSQSVFASNIFANNILAAITTKNYWDTVNEFKPLMHFWYLGIIIQFYFIFPLILLFVRTIVRKLYPNKILIEKWLLITIIMLGFVSCILYLSPFFNNSDKFYFLPFRIWEFCIGGIIGFIMKKKDIKINSIISFFAVLLLIICFCINPKDLSDLNFVTVVGAAQFQVVDDLIKVRMLLGVVLLSSILLFKSVKEVRKNFLVTLLVKVGKMSFSIFVWHQILLAFARYSLIDNMTWGFLFVFFLVLGIISYFSYKYLESIKLNNKKRILCYSFLVIMLLISFGIYRNGGVVRDVPELDITLENPLANRNTEYTDKIYDYNKDFASTDKIKVLVVGNSFARDFACVLLEWDVNHIIELSYLFFPKEDLSRYSECDYLFYFGSKKTISNSILERLRDDCKVYGIGTKSYGRSFGRIYAKRFDKDYFESSIPEDPLCSQINAEWKKSWDGNFIDFMEASKTDDGSIRLFTDNHKVISFDCRHLTKAGAIFYAKQLNLDKIFNNK